jgi:hypothetical protein
VAAIQAVTPSLGVELTPVDVRDASGHVLVDAPIIFKKLGFFCRSFGFFLTSARRGVPAFRRTIGR